MGRQGDGETRGQGVSSLFVSEQDARTTFYFLLPMPDALMPDAQSPMPNSLFVANLIHKTCH